MASAGALREVPKRGARRPHGGCPHQPLMLAPLTSPPLRAYWSSDHDLFS